MSLNTVKESDLHAYVDGALPEADREAITRFLAEHPDEAQRVRKLGWRGPILLLEGAFEQRDLEWCSRLSLWHVVHCDEQIDMLATHKTQEPHRVFLKMNSGMNRLGFRPAQFRAAWMRLNALPQVDEISLMTHFSDADSSDPAHAVLTQQVQTFVAATHDLPGERSLCNSAALLRHGQAAMPSPGTTAPQRHAAALTADWVLKSQFYASEQ